MCIKLLFDQNISYKIISRVEDIFPNSSHIARLNLDKASDRKIWEYAKENGYVIVSKDSDFNDLSILLGSPPYVIWIRSGNTRVKDIENLLRKYKDDIIFTIKNSENAIIEIIN